MKRAMMLTAGCAMLLMVAGCATNANRGGAYADYDTYDTGVVSTGPSESPQTGVQVTPSPATAIGRMEYEFGGGRIH